MSSLSGIPQLGVLGGGAQSPISAIRAGSGGASTGVSVLRGAAGAAGRYFGAEAKKYGLAMRFKVVVDGISDLGSWASCEGLRVEFKTEKVKQGGKYEYEGALLPLTVSYAPVTLKRAVDEQGSGKVASWLAAVAKYWVDYDPEVPDPNSSVPKDVLISLYGTDYGSLSSDQARVIQSWTLKSAYPVSWSGPSMNAKQNDFAMETLVLEHEGFLSSGSAVSELEQDV